MVTGLSEKVRVDWPVSALAREMRQICSLTLPFKLVNETNLTKLFDESILEPFGAPGAACRP